MNFPFATVTPVESFSGRGTLRSARLGCQDFVRPHQLRGRTPRDVRTLIESGDFCFDAGGRLTHRRFSPPRLRDRPSSCKCEGVDRCGYVDKRQLLFPPTVIVEQPKVYIRQQPAEPEAPPPLITQRSSVQIRPAQLAVKWPERRPRRWRGGHATSRSAWGTRRSLGTVRTPGACSAAARRDCCAIGESGRARPPGPLSRKPTAWT